MSGRIRDSRMRRHVKLCFHDKRLVLRHLRDIVGRTRDHHWVNVLISLPVTIDHLLVCYRILIIDRKITLRSVRSDDVVTTSLRHVQVLPRFFKTFVIWILIQFLVRSQTHVLVRVRFWFVCAFVRWVVLFHRTHSRDATQALERRVVGVGGHSKVLLTVVRFWIGLATLFCFFASLHVDWFLGLGCRQVRFINFLYFDLSLSVVLRVGWVRQFATKLRVRFRTPLTFFLNARSLIDRFTFMWDAFVWHTPYMPNCDLLLRVTSLWRLQCFIAITRSAITIDTWRPSPMMIAIRVPVPVRSYFQTCFVVNRELVVATW